MECPYCNAELVYEDSYGNHEYICHGDIRGKAGEIYQCPNHEGFKNEDEAVQYAQDNGIEYGLGWEEIVCDSGMFNGFFYTDFTGDLKEGYPC